MKIVLINGQYRSGKDYLGELIIKELDKLGYSSEHMSFAEPMKAIVANTFGITLEELDSYKNDKAPIFVQVGDLEADRISDFRTILQKFGTEGMKPVFGESVWATILYKKAVKSTSDFVVVTDFRFKVERIKDAITIKVFNDDLESNDSHASENDLADFVFDYEVDNTGKPDLTEDVEKIVQSLIYN